MSALRKPDWEGDQQPDADGSMAFLDHLDELRRRLIYCVAAIGAGLLVAMVFSGEILDFVMRPLVATLPEGRTFQQYNPAGGLTLRFRIAGVAGVLLASPMVLTQTWLFIAPGLYRDEKRLAIPFVALGSLLFVAGAAFAHYVVFPLTFEFFGSYETASVAFNPDIELTFGMYVRMLFGFAAVFQMPVLVLFLARMRLVTARFLVRHAKYAVLLIFIAAAVLTPGGDVFVQFLMAAPMLALYALGIVLAWTFAPRAIS